MPRSGPAKQRPVLLMALLALALGACRPQPASSRQAALPDAITVPAEITNNLVIAQVTLNGSPAASFIVDTGAQSSVVSAALADRLRLAKSGGGKASASGGDLTSSE